MDDICNANNLLLNKKFTQAIDKYTKILEKNPRNLIALNNMGYALTKLKKLFQVYEIHIYQVFINLRLVTLMPNWLLFKYVTNKYVIARFLKAKMNFFLFKNLFVL